MEGAHGSPWGMWGPRGSRGCPRGLGGLPHRRHRGIPGGCWGSPRVIESPEGGPHGVSLHGGSRGRRGGPVRVLWGCGLWVTPWGSHGEEVSGGPTGAVQALWFCAHPPWACGAPGGSLCPQGGFSVSPRGLSVPLRVSACSYAAPLRLHAPQGAAACLGAICSSHQQRAVARKERSRREDGAERPEALCHVAAPGSGGRRAAMSSSGGGNGAAAAGTETEAGDGFVSGSGSERRVPIMVEYW